MINKSNQDTPRPVCKTVCGGRIHDPENYPSAEYNGEILYFCVKGCLRAFQSDPEAFINGEIEHPLGEN